jgi:arylformamidase
VHVFLHGGYWRAQDKANFAFIAASLVPRGVTVVIANYPLCPRATLDDVIAGAFLCLEWVAHNIVAHGGDAARITLSGHSAGAHLVAAILAQDWAARGVAADIVKGALLISGIFDTQPAALTSVNADLYLTPDQIARHDYERIAPTVRCPVWVAAGGEEPLQWIDQSLRYAQHLRRHGMDAGVLILPGVHHFTIIDQFADEASDLMRCLARLIGFALKPAA